MKKKSLIAIPIILILTTLIFYIIFKKNIADDILYNAWPFFVGFAIVNIIHFFYLLYIFYLRKKGRVKTIAVFLSAPPVVIIIISVIIFFLVYRIIMLGRIRQLDFGSESFDPCADFKSRQYVLIWGTDYWRSDDSFYKKYHDKEKNKIQKKRLGCLTGHFGTELTGWPDEKIKSAFGEPSKLIKMEGNLEKWIYHPWTNHPDWEMPVYVKNNKLLKIGD